MNSRRRRMRVALWSVPAVLLALLVSAVAFDEVWLRPLLQRYVMQHAGRRIDFDASHLGLDASLQPVLRFRNLLIQNAAWASSKAPFVRAGQLGLTIAWSSLWHDPKVITRLDMVDADIDLERRADGLRNWRLGDPEDRGPGRVRILTLDASRSRLRIEQQALDLDLSLQTQPLPETHAAAAGADLPATKTLALRGTRHGNAFAAQAVTSDVLSLYDTGRPFTLEGELTSGQARLALRGRVHDLMQVGGLEGQLTVSGARPGDLLAVVAVDPRIVPALEGRMEAQVRKEGDLWQVTGLSARWGDSDVSGSFDYRDGKAAGTRPALHAVLTSERIDPKQLAMGPGARGVRVEARVAAAAPASSAAPAAAAPPEPTGSRWRVMDADVDWKVGALGGLPVPVTGVHATVSGRAGRWTLEPVELEVAGGRVGGNISLDLAGTQAAAASILTATRVRLDAFTKRQIDGRLDAHADLRANGDTLQALLASASGQVNASLLGATLPSTLEAKLGLDGGGFVEALLGGSKRSPVRCSAFRLALDRGVGRVQRLVLETDELVLDGTGSMDLPQHSINLTLTPHRRHSALLALDKSIHVAGSPGAMAFKLVATPDGSKVDACSGRGLP